MNFHLKTLENTLSVGKIANLHFFEFEKNFSTENDRHPFYELVFVASGNLIITSDGFSGKLSRNEMILHKPNESHSLSCPPHSSPAVIIIGFECTASGLENFSTQPIPLDENGIKKLAEIVKEGRNVFAPPYDVPTYDMKKKTTTLFGSEQMLKNLLEYFLIDCIRKAKFDEQLNASYRQPYGFHVKEVEQYLSENFLEKITIDELAFLFGTNRATLCREFKNAYGRTIGEYLNDKKISHAKEQISTTDKTFTEIAYDMNFETIHYFTRFFKKQTGKTPKEYRQKGKKDGN